MEIQTQNPINPLDLYQVNQATVYARMGNQFRPVPVSATHFVPNLDVGVYVINRDMQGPFFEHAIDFGEPGRVYGNANARADRILNTFKNREGGLGVLCVGEKGSGKTMLSKIIAHRAGLELGIPTIIINTPLEGDDFYKMISSLPSAVVLFDEFEKVYPEDEDQAKILTLLEGVYSSKKLFMFTANRRYKLNEYMLNRPGRIFYYFEYNTLEREFITEYCEENLKDKSQMDSVLSASSIIGGFNFDMLKSMVEEMNRYNESAKEVMEVLNIRPVTSQVAYDQTVVINGVEISPKDFWTPLDDDDNPLTRDSIRLDVNTWFSNTTSRIIGSTDPKKEEMLINLATGISSIFNSSYHFETVLSTGTKKSVKEAFPVEIQEDMIGTGNIQFSSNNLKNIDQVTGGIEYASDDGIIKFLFTPKTNRRDAYFDYL